MQSMPRLSREADRFLFVTCQELEMLEKTVSNTKELDALMARVKKAQAEYAQFTQEQVDRIFRSAALAAADARIPLAAWRSPRPAWAFLKTR
jgi:acyl-CoA reductase-like NAD-dependent aldehyde dehydrogenase